MKKESFSDSQKSPLPIIAFCTEPAQADHTVRKEGHIPSPSFFDAFSEDDCPLSAPSSKESRFPASLLLPSLLVLTEVASRRRSASAPPVLMTPGLLPAVARFFGALSREARVECDLRASNLLGGYQLPHLFHLLLLQFFLFLKCMLTFRGRTTLPYAHLKSWLSTLRAAWPTLCFRLACARCVTVAFHPEISRA